MFFEGPYTRDHSDEIDGVGAGPEATKPEAGSLQDSFKKSRERVRAGAVKTTPERIKQIEAGVWPPKVSPEDDREMHHSSQDKPKR